ncbi:class I SAM-dependent methyltransferase [Pelagicoccus sp. SDUM812003]|uniref:class I SAM-dependent methyltransferase n=1 Tax=Pelagicoccus sp. SDUM812003 TaxID=3041267 RepID=UPI00281039D2|nr:class I SAM-dependent methyltransferase [Pelagicoccus sp. SDUM812003]MDQ8202274.1 class I SAM-dependent methyltransferase [Pelagicoccus sp. SDUM812003]
MDTDAHWEKWGELDPYYAVLTNDSYRSANLTDQSKKAFFDSGESHLREVLAKCRHYLDAEFEPASAVDFGCGTGRVLIPMGREVETAVGIDVSSAMLEEARRNCQARGLGNVSLVKGDDHLSGLAGEFDFIHSFIVLQHIPKDRGMRILNRLLGHLKSGGIGAIQVTYSRLYDRNTRRFSRGMRARRFVRRLVARLRRAVRGAGSEREPPMLMTAYDLGEVFDLLCDHGISRIYSEATNHQDTRGVFLYFQKA